MATESRRAFHQQALSSLLTFSLLDTLFRHDVVAAEVKPITDRWLADVHQLALDLKGQKLEQRAWQAKIEELYAKVNLPDLLRWIDFDRLSADLKLADHGARSLRVQFPQVEGVPEKLVFGKQVFALKQGRSVVPHGHNNMATAFLILKGDLQGRHYDRVKDEPAHFVIKPTIDRKFVPGEFSTVSDFKDNVHWFKALTEPAFILNIHVMDVNPGAGQSTGRVYLDPQGEKLAGGLIRARRVDYDEVNRLYG